MAKKTNPKLIGAFVVGAIALLIVGTLGFGGGQYFKPKGKAVIFFEGSLAGLDIGSPVTFRGIKVGTVTDIIIEYDIEKRVLYVPVYLEIDPSRFEITSGQRNVHNIGELIKRGLRGQLEVQSLVTGQVSIDFDFHPEVPLRLTGLDPNTPELPSMPSEIEQLKATFTSVLDKIAKLPLDKIAANLNTALLSADTTLKQARETVANLDAELKPLIASLQKASDHAGDLFANADAALPQLVAGAEQTFKSASIALDQADRTLRSAQAAVGADSPLYYEINSTLRDIRSTSVSIRALADYLQRNPNALLTGKK